MNWYQTQEFFTSWLTFSSSDADCQTNSHFIANLRQTPSYETPFSFLLSLPVSPLSGMLLVSSGFPLLFECSCLHLWWRSVLYQLLCPSRFHNQCSCFFKTSTFLVPLLFLFCCCCCFCLFCIVFSILYCLHTTKRSLAFSEISPFPHLCHHCYDWFFSFLLLN